MALISTYARNEPFIGAESAYFLEDYTTSEITVPLNSSNELSATAVGLLAINKNLGTNLSTTIAAIGTLNLNKNLGTNLSTTIVSNGFYTIENPLLAQANITSAVSGFYAIENPLQTSIGSIDLSSSGVIHLDHQLQSNIGSTYAIDDSGLYADDYTEDDCASRFFISGAHTVLRPLESINSIDLSSSGVIHLDHRLQSIGSIDLGSSGVIHLDHQLQSNIGSIDLGSSGTHTVLRPLESINSIDLSSSGVIHLDHRLQSIGSIDLGSSGTHTVLRPLESINSIDLGSSGVIHLDHQLQSNINLIYLDQVGTIEVFTYLSAEPLLFINTFAEIESLRPVNSNLSINLSVLNQLNITKHLESTNNIELSTTSTGELSTAIQGIISCDIMSSGQLNLTNNLPGIINLDITTEGSITVERNLISAIECEISSTILQGFTFVNSITTINTSIHALLDVNGNTVGSPGGIPSEGFEPPNSLLLARHSESDAAQTYFITADFSSIENPNINTEIIGYSLSEQLPQDIVEFSMEGSALAIRLNTPSPILPFFVRFRTKDHQLKTRLNTFVTGEQHRVDYFLLDKKSIPIELKINVVARSYDSFGNTLEVRNADYILIIIGDYSISRNKLLSALETGGL